MIRLKALLALAISATLLAACQQPNSGANRAPTVAEDDGLAEAFAAAEAKQAKNYQPSPFFKAKVKDLTLKMMDRLMSKCLDADGDGGMQACFHERMLAGFDRDGTLKSHCPSRVGMDDDVECIIIGGMGQVIASKLGDEAVAAFDWTDPKKSTHDVMVQLVLQQVRNCLSNGSASDAFDCVVARVSKSFDLSSSDLEPCAEFKDDDVKFGNCVGESFGYKYLSAGTERM
jgi:hypothetical protein